MAKKMSQQELERKQRLKHVYTIVERYIILLPTGVAGVANLGMGSPIPWTYIFGPLSLWIFGVITYNVWDYFANGKWKDVASRMRR